MDPTISSQIQSEVDSLGPDDQLRVLEFVRNLGHVCEKRPGLPPGTPGTELIRAAEQLDFSPDDLREMAEAIEEGCEQVDPSEW